ncbi:unnamed protein product [Didymodactylos carnosus]|uniref:Uncharacterized protein n=1 Tax=Didymodactylos carnosus TaxID=1234261 RepID=A0A814ZAV6_9BILA|nr:unnamed protein product [Didymodactylos carnosus]CAF1242707.1 unnamed protein product [Didymodactylos carnosus]CAF4006549.1 unnamed protein product [Didymodactylos carnosus]CAF4011539.1 unnamed protein product [Didymodactylos carnosus]
MTTIECPYSEEILTTIKISVLNYINNLSRSSVIFVESNTVRDIVDAAFKIRTQVTQWYEIFILFNVLMHYRSKPNDSNRIKAARDIVEYGLQLLRDLIVMRKILEPTFARIGVQILIKEMTQLEKCLLSLALGDYPMVQYILCQLDVSTIRTKYAFKPPSRRLVREKRSSYKPEYSVLPSISIVRESTGAMGLLVSVFNNNDYALKKMMRTNDNQPSKDSLKLVKMKLEKMIQRNADRNLQTSVQSVASEILDQFTYPTKPILISDEAGQIYMCSNSTSSIHAINADLEKLTNHLNKKTIFI